MFLPAGVGGLAEAGGRGYPSGAMAELAVTIFVVILVLGAVKIPALGDAIGRRLRGPTAPRPEAEPQAPLSGPERAGTR